MDNNKIIANEIKKGLQTNRYSEKPFMTEEEFKRKLQDDGYTGETFELALKTYQNAKNAGYDVTAYYDELYGKIDLFDN